MARYRPATVAVVLLFCFTTIPRVHGLAATYSQVVSLQQLLSTCIEACQRGCLEIWYVEEKRLASASGKLEGVEFKQLGNPRSALTEADGRAQRAIVTALQAEWGELLTIVGEEDDDNDEMLQDTDDSDNLSSIPPLKRDLCQQCDATKDISVDLADVTVFVDPLDGTREFVEGRLANCQTLVGIAWKGEAIAGAVGIPFPHGDLISNDSDSTIIYGHVGAGFGVIGTPLLTPNITTTQQQRRPVLLLGDSTHHVMKDIRTTVLQDKLGGTHVVGGGAGTKLLATALGHVDGTLSIKYGGPWDTCAPQAILRSMGGTMTDMAGNPLRIHQPGACRHHNRLGFVATGKDSSSCQDDLIRALQQSDLVQEYIREGKALIS